MQQLVLHRKIFTLQRIDETEYSSIVYERLKKLQMFDKLGREGAKVITICEALETPKATLYRWKKDYKSWGLAGLEKQSTAPHRLRQRKWPPHLEQAVLNLRIKNPLYGKNKIARLLKRDLNILVSVSTVGRIITILLKKNLIKSASSYYARRVIKPRLFNNHAQRLKSWMKAKAPGEYIQIDHMSVSVIADFSVKHFQAICPITKFVVEEAYSAATSNIASMFLELVQKQMPFPIQSIQVDGGSEFRGEFERACKTSAIPLFVTPPRSPEINGTVERANGAAKFEFYYLYEGMTNLFNLRKALKRYVDKYNKYRPHQSLQYLTPLEYYRKIEAIQKSQMY
jgi:transposase InsO family protein